MKLLIHAGLLCIFRLNMTKKLIVVYALCATGVAKVLRQLKVVSSTAAMTLGLMSTALFGLTKFLKKWTEPCKMFTMRWPELAAHAVTSVMQRVQLSAAVLEDVPSPSIFPVHCSQKPKRRYLIASVSCATNMPSRKMARI